MAEDDVPSTALVPSPEGPRFSVGDAVRVRVGVIDPDFPDIPLDGWAGVVAECDETSPPLYLVRWTAETLSRLVPAYRVRCDREGMDADETWLLGKDLERDAGGPLAIVVPQKLRPRPLDRDDSGDRVRAILGLTSDDPLPPVDAASLRRFHEHFTRDLGLPQSARFDDGPAHELLLIRRLLPWDDAGLEGGLLVEVAKEDETADVPLALLSLWADGDTAEDVNAYGEWFRDAGEDDEPAPPFPFLGRLPGLQILLGRLLLACILLGTLFGAILWSHELAVPLAQGGGLLFGVLGLLIGSRSEAAIRRTLRRPPGFGIGLLLGSALGLVGGAVGGVLLLGFLGAIPGAILGSLLGQLLSACGVRPPTFRLVLVGAYLGAGVDSYLRSEEGAVAGAVRGAVGGVGVFLVGYALMRWMMSRLPGPGRRSG